jgi:hypothetical protein
MPGQSGASGGGRGASFLHRPTGSYGPFIYPVTKGRPGADVALGLSQSGLGS